MCKHTVVLTADEEQRLNEIANSEGKSGEEILREIVAPFLTPPHSMDKRSTKAAYDEWAQVYLSWSEKGTE